MEGNCFTIEQRWEFIKKTKQESKKTRKQELDQESDQENKKEKKENFLFLDHFLGRVLVFLFSYFLVLIYKFPPLTDK